MTTAESIRKLLLLAFAVALMEGAVFATGTITGQSSSVHGTDSQADVLRASYYLHMSNVGDTIGSGVNYARLDYGGMMNAPGSLDVIKHVVGGNKTASAFTLSVKGTNAIPASFAGSENGTMVALSPGHYSVSESGPSGYASVLSPGCSGTVASGQNLTCTVTNTFGNGTRQGGNDNETQTEDRNETVEGGNSEGGHNDDNGGQHHAGTGNLLVVKDVIGGNLTASDFTLSVTGVNATPSSFPGSANGTMVVLSAGTYSVSEAATAGYASSLSPDCNGTIAAGQNLTCTVTNTFGNGTGQGGNGKNETEVENETGGGGNDSHSGMNETGGKDDDSQGNVTTRGNQSNGDDSSGTNVSRSPGDGLNASSEDNGGSGTTVVSGSDDSSASGSVSPGHDNGGGTSSVGSSDENHATGQGGREHDAQTGIVSAGGSGSSGTSGGNDAASGGQSSDSHSGGGDSSENSHGGTGAGNIGEESGGHNDGGGNAS